MSKKSRWQVIYRYICRSSKNPESLARAAGLGLFIGFLPSIGFQILLAVFVAGFFNANRLITVLGTLVTNPFTAIPISAFSLWIGDWILPGSRLSAAVFENLSWNSIFTNSKELFLPYLVGCLTLSTVSGFIGYTFVKLCFAKKRE